MTFGEDWGWGSTPAESAAILGRFLGRGGNFIDTANVYTKGPLGGGHRRSHRRQPRPPRSHRHRDEVLRQPVSRRSERRRRRT